jgi:glucan biosynthesis protein C
MFTYLSDASYTIYLFHQVFVVLFGVLLLGVPISIYLKYPVIVLGSIAATLVIHHFLILRVGVLRLMFNGKGPKKPPSGGGAGMSQGSREQKEAAPRTALA